MEGMEAYCMYSSNPDIPLIWPIQREVNKPKSGAGWANHPKTVVADKANTQIYIIQ